jgi:hypothetical protein
MDRTAAQIENNDGCYNLGEMEIDGYLAIVAAAK